MPHNGPVRRVLTSGVAFVVFVTLLIAGDVVPVFDVPGRDLRIADRTTTAPLRVAVVGDSLSAGRSRFLGNGLDDESWMRYAEGDPIEFAGGWARSGARPDQMAAEVQPVADVDVLVLLAGTNAVRTGKTLAEEATYYDQIVSTVRPETVLVSAIPPYRTHESAALAYNTALRALSEDRGWTWVDPWGFARQGDDWTDGFSVDGMHPAGPEQYAALGDSFRRIILDTRGLPSAV
jgi:hypothetical protein